jgi:hypothetical protein
MEEEIQENFEFQRKSQKKIEQSQRKAKESQGIRENHEKFRKSQRKFKESQHKVKQSQRKIHKSQRKFEKFPGNETPMIFEMDSQKSLNNLQETERKFKKNRKLFEENFWENQENFSVSSDAKKFRKSSEKFLKIVSPSKTKLQDLTNLFSPSPPFFQPPSNNFQEISNFSSSSPMAVDYFNIFTPKFDDKMDWEGASNESRLNDTIALFTSPSCAPPDSLKLSGNFPKEMSMVKNSSLSTYKWTPFFNQSEVLSQTTTSDDFELYQPRNIFKDSFGFF